MSGLESAVAVMPPVYEIPLGMWRWCRLSEVCEVVPGIAKLAGNTFEPTPEVLVHHFAGLVRLNRVPDHLRGTPNEPEKKKIFRYSMDGKSFWGTEVPLKTDIPPYTPFVLEIGTPYPEGLFVPEGWVIDTLKAIRMGAIAAADFDGRKMGFGPESSDRLVFDLEKNDGGMALVRLPKLK